MRLCSSARVGVIGSAVYFLALMLQAALFACWSQLISWDGESGDLRDGRTAKSSMTVEGIDGN